MNAQTLQTLAAAVAATTGTEDSATVLITGFGSQLAAANQRASDAIAAGVAKDQVLADLQAEIAAATQALADHTAPLAAAVASVPVPTPAPVFGVSPTSISVDVSHAPLPIAVTTPDGSTPSFISRDESVATVSADGVVTPVAPGDTFIDITAGPNSASVEVIILAA